MSTFGPQPSTIIAILQFLQPARVGIRWLTPATLPQPTSLRSRIFARLGATQRAVAAERRLGGFLSTRAPATRRPPRIMSSSESDTPLVRGKPNGGSSTSRIHSLG